jgi:hypothetical protein
MMASAREAILEARAKPKAKSKSQIYIYLLKKGS